LSGAVLPCTFKDFKSELFSTITQTSAFTDACCSQGFSPILQAFSYEKFGIQQPSFLILTKPARPALYAPSKNADALNNA